MWELLEAIAIIPTSILLLILLSQYAISLRKKDRFGDGYHPSVSILVPCHNEEEHVRQTVQNLLDDPYPGRKQVICIDDGSTDKTLRILESFGRRIVLIRTDHIGKSKSLNLALKKARGEVILVVDGDSVVEGGSIQRLVAPLRDRKVGAVASTLKVRNPREGIMTWFQRVEYLYFSFFRSLCDRVNATIFTPGPLSAYKRSVLNKVGGFASDLFMEDVDVSLRIIKAGFRIRVSEFAVSRTAVPNSLRSWYQQRNRWMKGGIEIIKRNRDFYFRKRFGGGGFYSLPILTYWYFHSLVMGIIIFYQIFGGYYQWFWLNGAGFSLPAAQYFAYWFSVLGIINLTWQILVGAYVATPLMVLSIAVTLLNYPLYIYPFIRYREGFGWRDAFVLFFLFPYWILVLLVQTKSNLTWFKRSKGKNIWKK